MPLSHPHWAFKYLKGNISKVESETLRHLIRRLPLNVTEAARWSSGKHCCFQTKRSLVLIPEFECAPCFCVCFLRPLLHLDSWDQHSGWPVLLQERMGRRRNVTACLICVTIKYLYLPGGFWKIGYNSFFCSFLKSRFRIKTHLSLTQTYYMQTYVVFPFCLFHIGDMHELFYMFCQGNFSIKLFLLKGVS